MTRLQTRWYQPLHHKRIRESNSKQAQVMDEARHYKMMKESTSNEAQVMDQPFHHTMLRESNNQVQVAMDTANKPKNQQSSHNPKNENNITPQHLPSHGTQEQSGNASASRRKQKAKIPGGPQCVWETYPRSNPRNKHSNLMLLLQRIRTTPKNQVHTKKMPNLENQANGSLLWKKNSNPWDCLTCGNEKTYR